MRRAAVEREYTLSSSIKRNELISLAENDRAERRSIPDTDCNPAKKKAFLWSCLMMNLTALLQRLQYPSNRIICFCTTQSYSFIQEVNAQKLLPCVDLIKRSTTHGKRLSKEIAMFVHDSLPNIL